MLKSFFKKLPAGPTRNLASSVWHFWKKVADGMLVRLKYGSTVERVSVSGDELAALRKKGYQSQFGQDYFISSRLISKNSPAMPGSFPSLGDKIESIFVDVGANHPVRNSNSYFFEKTLGWRVIAIDAQVSFRSEWERYRSASFVNCCVGAKIGTTGFIQYHSPTGWEDQLSCVSSRERPEDKNIERDFVTVDVVPLDKILADFSVTTVDVLSIDVEGFESEVLAGIDFSKIRPKVILIENCRPVGGDNSIREFMDAQDYDFTMRIWTADDVYVDRRNKQSAN